MGLNYFKQGEGLKCSRAYPKFLECIKEDAVSREFICLCDEKVYGGFFLPEAIKRWTYADLFGVGW